MFLNECRIRNNPLSIFFEIAECKTSGRATWQPVNADRGSIGIACVFLIWRSKDILLALIFPSDGATVCGHSLCLNKHETDLRWLDDLALSCSTGVRHYWNVHIKTQ